MNTTFDELKLTGRLPSQSGVSMRILELTKSENYDAGEIGRIIQADPALTGRILKVANSAEVAGLRKVTTVSEATVRLGTHAVRNIALGFSLVSENRTGGCARFNYDRYWLQSLARAVAAQTLSNTTGWFAPADAFICALLARVGMLALANVHAATYAEVLAAAEGGSPKRLSEIERERLGIDHGEVAAAMLMEWGLPEVFGAAIQAYETHLPGPRKPDEAAACLSAILHFSHRIAAVLIADQDRDSVELTKHWNALAEVRETLALSEEDFHKLFDRIAAEWRDWGGILKVQTREVRTLADIAGELGSSARLQQELQVNSNAQSRRGLDALVVEADGTCLRELSRHLQEAGHTVTGFQAGSSALQHALKGVPSVVIAGWHLPDMDALDLCRALRRFEAGRSAYFIAMPDRQEESLIVSALDAGVDDCLVKPLSVSLLLARIRGIGRLLELRSKVEADKEIMRKQAADLGIMARQMRAASQTDVLTELPNRRYALKRLEQLWNESEKNGAPLSLISLDIDHFKRVNDTYGHEVGDNVLRHTAAAMKRCARRGEEPCRLGGEEFLILLSNTDLKGALACGERVRCEIAGQRLRCGGLDGSVTVSVGVAQRAPSMQRFDELLRIADQAVYDAKNLGRNRVCFRQPAAAPARQAV